MKKEEKQVDCPMPPRAFMEQIMDKVSKVYCYLWDIKDENGKISLKWEELNGMFQKNSFRSCIRKLKVHRLLTYKESESGVKLEIFNWE